MLGADDERKGPSVRSHEFRSCWHEESFGEAKMNVLVCPICRADLVVVDASSARCGGSACGRPFPIVNGVVDLLPDALLNEGSEPIETDYYDEMPSKRWSLGELTVEHFFRRLRQLTAVTASELDRRLDVLDIGSGNLLRGRGGEGGRFFRILREHCRSYVGVEPSWAMIREVNTPDGNIRHLPHATVVRSTGEALPVRPASFDLVTCIAVLDHCIAPPKVMARARQALRPGGRMIVSLRNERAWYREVTRRVAPGWFARVAAKDHHHHHFAPSDTLRLFAEAGFADTGLVELGYLLAPGMANALTLTLSPLKLLGADWGSRIAGSVDQVLSRVLPGLGQFFIAHGRAAA